MENTGSKHARKTDSKDFVITGIISGVVMAVFAILIVSSGSHGGLPNPGGSSPETPPAPIESSGPPDTVPVKLNNTCSNNTVNGTWVFFGTDKSHYQYDPRNKFIPVQAYGVIHASQKFTVQINMTGPLDEPDANTKPRTMQVVSSASVQDVRNKEFYYLNSNVPVNPNTLPYGSKFMLQAQYDKAWSCQSVFYIDHPDTS